MKSVIVFYSDESRAFADSLISRLEGEGVSCLGRNGAESGFSRVPEADVFAFLCGVSGRAPAYEILRSLADEKRAGWRSCELVLVYSRGGALPESPAGVILEPEDGAAERILSLIFAKEGLARRRGETLDVFGTELRADEVWLDLSKRDISALDPLAPLTKLEILFLQKNRIGGLEPLSGLTQLLVLFLFNNRISDISPLARLRRLGILYLFGNVITDISPLSGLCELSDLRLSLNDISDISALSGLNKLGVLHLWGNRVSDISALSGLDSLKELNLSDNNISDIAPLAGLRNLQLLDLSDNSIMDVEPLKSLSSLKELKLGGNPLGEQSLDELRQELPGCAIY